MLTLTYCDFQIEHPSASRMHAALCHHERGGLYLIDLKSAHHVFVDGKPLRPYEACLSRVRVRVRVRVWARARASASANPNPHPNPSPSPNQACLLREGACVVFGASSRTYRVGGVAPAAPAADDKDEEEFDAKASANPKPKPNPSPSPNP